jgi:GAF domain-containing protein
MTRPHPSEFPASVGYSHGRVLTPEEERLLSMFADQAALALESARVRGESEQRRREAEALPSWLSA